MIKKDKIIYQSLLPRCITNEKTILTIFVRWWWVSLRVNGEWGEFWHGAWGMCGGDDRGLVVLFRRQSSGEVQTVDWACGTAYQSINVGALVFMIASRRVWIQTTHLHTCPAHFRTEPAWPVLYKMNWFPAGHLCAGAVLYNTEWRMFCTLALSCNNCYLGIAGKLSVP